MDAPATTHWTRSADFARRFPRVKLDADRIFVKAGKFWSSAGITAGIDLSLALIAEDLGEAVARKVAQQLVVYYRRPGGQSQFSTLLELERADGRFAPLLDYVRSNLRERLSVEELAAKACMSPRNFARLFQAETGTSPARAVMRLRAETARAQIESGGASVQEIARNCGFGDPERMRRAFVSLFGGPPTALRMRTAGSAPWSTRGDSCGRGRCPGVRARPRPGAPASRIHCRHAALRDRVVEFSGSSSNSRLSM